MDCVDFVSTSSSLRFCNRRDALDCFISCGSSSVSSAASYFALCLRRCNGRSWICGSNRTRYFQCVTKYFGAHYKRRCPSSTFNAPEILLGSHQYQLVTTVTEISRHGWSCHCYRNLWPWLVVPDGVKCLLDGVKCLLGASSNLFNCNRT